MHKEGERERGTHEEENGQRITVDRFEQWRCRHWIGPGRDCRRGTGTIGLCCVWGSGVQSTFAAAITVAILVEITLPAHNLETRDRQIRALGERCWEKDKVEK
jgi:hypothetical protein